MRRQNGMSLSSILALLLIAVVAAKTAYTLIPMYWDNKLLTTVLDGMKESGDISATTSPKAVKDILSQRMNMNNIRIAFDELSIKKGRSGRLELDWPYERRDTWFGNVDLVVGFHQHIEF
ncbi:MAG: hypothetical protein CMI08_13575 [Oceanospirillaceae bacterium]|uniref:DUF4845 domain-containing protein n=1 Tax=unclassified Thalassolituus TaxID=2624967 RepID=UPI000C69CD9B|nr:MULTISPECIES: DUF4845 domain-containing protein [unclassified Thalassolituus]MAS24369.1 hypothetical protein [Oceanospirillaceae bacterium]MAY00203.1 hypothetical protein [Oceanospirillaceae bacterium]MBL34572.1 hypothetical protein [Oceanospirillaceae bacterium]MBS53775.1 hypothetical protein [Oceanospirillaceae bacterium]|tara:strand:- start:3005 stop:3364 length:360 start_codon:yes stop_codon:yes gene_type:complete